MMEDYTKQLEAILFAAGRAITISDMCNLLGITNEDLIHDSLLELKQRLIAENSPLSLFEEMKGVWKLTVVEQYQSIVSQIVPHTELSKTVLETLAVIAWKQPIFQSEVIAVRTNKAYQHIDDLDKIGFITKKKDGKTYKLSLTQKFFDYFNLSSPEELTDLFSKNQIPSTNDMNLIFDGPYTGKDESPSPLNPDNLSVSNLPDYHKKTNPFENAPSVIVPSHDAVLDSTSGEVIINTDEMVDNSMEDNVAIMKDMVSLLSESDDSNIDSKNDKNAQ